MPEEKPQPQSGKVYNTTDELCADIEQADDSRTLRIFGMRLIERESQTLPGKTYFDLEKALDDPNLFFDARIIKTKLVDIPENTSIQLGVFDYGRENEAGRPNQIFAFQLDKDNIQDWRIEVRSIHHKFEPGSAIVHLK